MGGDEFALIIKDTGEPEIIDVISERLKLLQGIKLCFNGIEIPTYFSFGSVTNTEEINSFDKLLHLADKKMYANKNSRKNKIASRQERIVWKKF